MRWVYISLAIATGLICCSRVAQGYEINEHLTVDGYFQSWAIVHEQMEEVNGLYQDISRHKAVDYATGFRLHRARLGANVSFFERLLGAGLQIQLERGFEIMDLYLTIQPLPWISFWVGQFKFPSTYENLQSSSQLDFVLRSQISAALSDYSLSRTTYASSLFAGNRSFLRDMGVGVKSEFSVLNVPVRLFFMIGNGLGANLFVGGRSAEEFVLTNGVQFFYGIRLEMKPLPEYVTIGGHFNYNKHDDIVFKSGRTVYDLYRMSYSSDLTINVWKTGVRLCGLYGAGSILEDFDKNGKDDFVYSGWEAKLIWEINPILSLLFPANSTENHTYRLSFRYDRLSTETDESGMPSHYHNWTFGVSYLFRHYLKVEFNAIWRKTDEPFVMDLRDDVYLFSLQFAV